MNFIQFSSTVFECITAAVEEQQFYLLMWKLYTLSKWFANCSAIEMGPARSSWSYLLSTLHDSLVFHKVELAGKLLDGWREMDGWRGGRLVGWQHNSVTHTLRQAECSDIC